MQIKTNKIKFFFIIHGIKRLSKTTCLKFTTLSHQPNVQYVSSVFLFPVWKNTKGIQKTEPRRLFFFFFFGLHPQHMEVPRLGVKSELQMLAYTRATATQDLSHIYDLHHSSRQCWILHPLSEDRDLT